MSRKDYYLILGIARTESPNAIRSAYRDLAHRYHPDRVGPQGTSRFQEINEAYEVLSDPARREAYDHESRGRSVRVQASPAFEQRPAPVAARPRRSGPIAEPMIADDNSLLRDFGVTRPLVEALHDRFWRSPPAPGDFIPPDLPKSRSTQPLTVELRLSPDQARCGGALALGVPVFHLCPACRGTGSDWGFGCLHCDATGKMETEEMVRVSLPSHLRDRDVLQVPIRHRGTQNLTLSLLVRVNRR